MTSKEMRNRRWFTGLLPDYWNDLGNVHCQVCDHLLQKLFRIFLLLSEKSREKLDPNINHGPPWIHIDEIKLFVLILMHHLPMAGAETNGIYRKRYYHYCAMGDDDILLEEKKTEHTFKEFTLLLSELFPYDREEFSTALAIVYDQLVNKVLKKGYLLWSSRKSGGIFGRWERRWVVVKPGVVILYKNQKEEEKVKEIHLSNKSNFEVYSGQSPLTLNGNKLYEFKIKISPGKRGYIGTFDILQRRQWITALEYASHNSPSSQQSPDQLISSFTSHRRSYLKRGYLGITRRVSPRQRIPNGNPCNPVVPSPANQQQVTVDTATATNEIEVEDEEYWRNLTVEALCKELRKERLRANRLALERKRLQDELDPLTSAIKDEEIVRELATRLFEEERAQRNALEEMNKNYVIELEEEKRQRKEIELEATSRMEEIRRLKEQLDQLHQRMTIKQVKKTHSTETERRQLLEMLKRDQEALLKHQQEMKNQLIQQKIYCEDGFDQVKATLNRLLENSRKVNGTTYNTVSF